MCWSVPGKIVELKKDNIASVELSGVRRDVVLDLIDNAAVGEYVLVHAGYALQRVSEDNATFTMDFFKKGKGNV